MGMMNLLERVRPLTTSALERRLHRRAVLYWQRLGGDQRLVALDIFDPHRVEDDLSHGFLLDLRGPQPTFSYVGPVLEQEAGLTEVHVPMQSVPAHSLLMRFASHYGRVLESRRPETAEYEFVTHAGYNVLCRSALLPLSSDGKTIDHVYGAVSWKSERLSRPS